MITRRLTAADVPAMQVIVTAADECGDIANPAHDMPEDLKAIVLNAIALNTSSETFRYFGSFDDKGNLLFFAGFFMWTNAESKVWKPNYGIRGHWATRSAKLEFTVDPKKNFSDAYIATINAAVKYFEGLGFTSFWVRRPAHPKFNVIAFQDFCLLSKYKPTNVYKIAKGDAYPNGFDEKNEPPNYHLIGIDGKPFDYDALVVRYDK